MTGVVQIAAAAYGLLFLGAALGKFDGWTEWVEAVRRFPLVEALRKPVAVLVLSAEALVAVLAVSAPAIGLAASATLLAVFGGLVLALRKRLAGQECNCFGAAMPSEIGLRLAARDFVLAAVAAAGSFGALRWKAGSLSLAQLVPILLAGLLIVMAGEFVQFRRAETEQLGPGR